MRGMKTKGLQWVSAPSAVVMCWMTAGAFAAGCNGGDKCEPRYEQACVDDQLYWFDSCGNADELIDHCECGCTLNRSDCADCDCIPDCGTRECGFDPVCGSLNCGTCDTGTECNGEGFCEGECIPDCAGHECGSDGCGDNSNCGECDAEWSCNRAGACVKPETCNNGQLETYEECEGLELRNKTCESLGYDAGELTCAGDCVLETSQCRKCGNGVLEPGEVCDGDDFGDMTCESLGYVGGSLFCIGHCSAYSTDQCLTCGNGIKDEGEICDRTDFGGATCESNGFTGGVLSCAGECDSINKSGCSCDNSSDCADCWDCAAMSPAHCFDQLFACVNSADDCFYIMRCIDEECAGDRPTCVEECKAAHPDGVASFADVESCVFCDHCYNDCDGASAGCP